MIIGVIGLGTVGYGVVDILCNEKKRLSNYLNQEVVVKYGCAMEERDLPDGVLFTRDYKDVLNDPEVDVVVELIGGTTIAKAIIMEAIEKGKHVVTANKALIAHDGKEILLAANKHNVHVFYEAAVGGGIPVVTPQYESLVANNIREITGILNGTTNFILSLMETDNLDFEEALTIADGLGYLEADPSLDIDGIDAAHKIAILANNAFDGFVDFERLKPQGIRNVTKLDMDYAKKMGYRIKLIARAKKEDDKYFVDVSPTLVSKNDMVANVMGAYNVVEFNCDYVENVLFYGKGAGRYVTASAVVGDIIKVSQSYNWQYSNKTIENIYPITKSKYYLRLDHAVDIDYEYYYSEKNVHIYITKEIEIEQLLSLLKNETYSSFKVRG
ncbi:homoserine dehydrogenase [Beduini massiliensis]|uniref:homoserine dehydrogenase n=1 Tax=Beduini massiliensis TaxID=1585974 RepID=UPI00059A7AF9|nr:homoserine dehydrogenase [Beduini massiliensis]